MVSFVGAYNLNPPPPLFLGGTVAATSEPPRGTCRAQPELASHRIGHRLGRIPALGQRALASRGPAARIARQSIRRQASGSRDSSAPKARRRRARPDAASEVRTARLWTLDPSWAVLDSHQRNGATIHSLQDVARVGASESPFSSGLLKWVPVERLDSEHSISVAEFTGARSSKKG